jgi:hypothetical protein
MRIWYSIRRPIGYVLMALIAYIALGVLHGIPFLLTDLLLGR